MKRQNLFLDEKIQYFKNTHSPQENYKNQFNPCKIWKIITKVTFQETIHKQVKTAQKIWRKSSNEEWFVLGSTSLSQMCYKAVN